MAVLALAWKYLLFEPLIWSLTFLSSILFHNLGLGIITLTLAIRLVLIPLTLPSLKAMQKQREIQGELNELKGKYKDDKKKQGEEQMKLLAKHGINPAAGCLPQILQLVILAALYNVFTTTLKSGSGDLSSNFLYLDLTKPDPSFILPGLSGAAQLWASKLMLPTIKKEEKLAKKTEDKKDDVMYNMQEQSLYLFPILTVFFLFKLPSGLGLYWLSTTIFSIVQQVVVNRSYGKK